MNDLFIARQPIFDQNLKLYGYELLHRQQGETLSTTINDVNQATSQIISMGVIEIGLEKLVGQHKAFINLSPDYILDPNLLNFSNDNVVFEIPVNFYIDEKAIENTKKLFDNKQVLALDDTYPEASTLELLPYINIIKHILVSSCLI